MSDDVAFMALTLLAYLLGAVVAIGLAVVVVASIRRPHDDPPGFVRDDISKSDAGRSKDTASRPHDKVIGV